MSDFGTAVITSAGGKELKLEYDNIVHTTRPFYNYPPLITQEVQQLLGINFDRLIDQIQIAMIYC
jgi:hypothetical protein